MSVVNRQRGVTLIELVVTLTTSLVVVAFVSMFVSGPVAGYMDQSRRAGLVDAADTAIRRLGRDVRRALPNSTRVTSAGGVVALEMLGSIDGARYRDAPPGSAAQVLDFSAADDAFNVIGPFTQIVKPFSSTTHYLAIYNVGVPGANAYELANVITPPGTQIDIATDTPAGEDRVSLSPPFRFAFGSPSQRVYLLEGPISYLCEPAAGMIRRYDGYAIAADHSTRDSHAELIGAGARVSVVADRIVGCGFNYTPGTAERAGLVSVRVDVSEAGETISLLSQAHVGNVP